MKVFMSHSSRDKALVREVRSYLPRYIQTWLDDDDLLVGEGLRISIKQAIKEDADYMVIFLGRDAIQSKWVKRELEWALERERKIGRTFVLPVLLEDCWSEVQPIEFQDRKYLKCFDQSERGVKALAESLSSEIFAHLARNLDDQGRKELEAEKEREAAKAGVDALAGIAGLFADINKKWMQNLYRKCTQYADFPPETQLQKIADCVAAELKYWRSKGKRKSVPPPHEEESKSGLGAGMRIMADFAGDMSSTVNREKIQLLEEIDDLIKTWQQAGASVDPAKILERILSRLREAASA